VEWTCCYFRELPLEDVGCMLFDTVANGVVRLLACLEMEEHAEKGIGLEVRIRRGMNK
jgi:hypothetical protein